MTMMADTANSGSCLVNVTEVVCITYNDWHTCLPMVD